MKIAPRDEFFEAVRYCRMSPDEAEDEAKHLGCGPLREFLKYRYHEHRWQNEPFASVADFAPALRSPT